jgi:hypothetical protein
MIFIVKSDPNNLSVAGEITVPSLTFSPAANGMPTFPRGSGGVGTSSGFTLEVHPGTLDVTVDATGQPGTHRRSWLLLDRGQAGNRPALKPGAGFHQQPRRHRRWWLATARARPAHLLSMLVTL